MDRLAVHCRNPTSGDARPINPASAIPSIAFNGSKSLNIRFRPYRAIFSNPPVRRLVAFASFAACLLSDAARHKKNQPVAGMGWNTGLLQNATASSILEDMADEATAIDLNFLAKQMERLLKEAAGLRRDVAKSIVLATQNLEFSRRIERRFGEVDERVSQMGRRIDELKDDFEVMLKAELSGSLANFEDRVEAKISELGEEPHPD